MSRDHVVDVSCDFVHEISSSWATTLQSLGSAGLVKVEIYCFWFVTWPRDRCVTWFCRWDHIILSHYPAKLGVHRPCESGDITYFICHVTTNRSATWLCGWGPLILSHRPAKIGVHRPYRTGSNCICNISSNSSSNSNSNSNAEVPMPRFTNGPMKLGEL